MPDLVHGVASLDLGQWVEAQLSGDDSKLESGQDTECCQRSPGGAV
jgi:hypothetical protein